MNHDRLGAILKPFWHRAGPVAEQPRAEPSRAEPSRAGPGRAERIRAEPSWAGPGRAESIRAEQPGVPRTLRGELCFSFVVVTGAHGMMPYM